MTLFTEFGSVCANEEAPDEAVKFERGISAKLRAELLDRNGFTCQMCGLTPGDLDPATGRKVRLHLGHITDKSLVARWSYRTFVRYAQPAIREPKI